MNRNYGFQHQSYRAWDGTTSYPRRIIHFTDFHFDFEVTAAIATDAVFNIEAAPPSDADPCVPGAWAPVPEIAFCDSPGEPGPQATVTIPAGTAIGSHCFATVPCRPGAFVRLVAASGTTASVFGTIVLSGPM